MLESRLPIAIDIGGTFTDLQVLEEGSGRSFPLKCPATPADPSLGIMHAFDRARDTFGFDAFSPIFRSVKSAPRDRGTGLSSHRR